MQVKHTTLATLLAAATLALAALGTATAVRAMSPDWSRVDSADLERLYWDCDAQATQEALSGSDGALCVMASDALKERLFDGDFERMLAWWQASKTAEHARRGIAAPAAAALDPDEAALQAP